MNMPFKFKTMLAGAVAGIAPIITFLVVGIITLNFTLGLLTGIAAVIISVFTAVLIIRDPMTRVLSGEGILVQDLNATGYIPTYVCQVRNPDMTIKTPQGEFRTVFDKELTTQLKAPQNAVTWQDPKTGYYCFALPPDTYQDAKTRAFGVPNIYWNSKTGVVLTKQALNNQENNLLVQSLALTCLRVHEELRKDLKILSNTVANQFGQNFLSFLSHPIVKILMVVALIVFAILFLGPMVPKVLEQFMGSGVAATPVIPDASAIPKL